MAQESLREDFFREAEEICLSLEELLLELENRPENKDLINQAFRAMHTLKGNAGLVGEERINRLCHAAENLLDLARSGKMTLSGPPIQIVLDTLDLLKRLISEKNSPDLEEAVSNQIDKLKELQEEKKTYPIEFEDYSSFLLEILPLIGKIQKSLIQLIDQQNYLEALFSLSEAAVELSDQSEKVPSVAILARALERMILILSRQEQRPDELSIEALQEQLEELKEKLTSYLWTANLFKPRSINSLEELPSPEALLKEEGIHILELNLAFSEELAKRLKELCRQEKVILVAPYNHILRHSDQIEGINVWENYLDGITQNLTCTKYHKEEGYGQDTHC